MAFTCTITDPVDGETLTDTRFTVTLTIVSSIRVKHCQVGIYGGTAAAYDANDDIVYDWERKTAPGTGTVYVELQGRPDTHPVLEHVTDPTVPWGAPYDGDAIHLRAVAVDVVGNTTVIDTVDLTAASLEAGMTKNATTFDWFEQGRWYQCARCGFTFHESDMAIDPKSGLRVCTIGPNDLDDHEFGMFEVPITSKRDPIYRGEED